MKDYLYDINQLKKYVENELNSIYEYFKQDNTEMIVELCISMQQKIINIGTLLENEYGLENTSILRVLEIMCEVCYRCVENNISVETFISVMKYKIQEFEYCYAWSIQKDSYDLSIVAIVKNEKYIIEWIEYHLLVGVNHFYIYDNDSTDGLKDKLKKYIDTGIVTYIYYPGKYIQVQSYIDAIQNFKYNTKWLAIIDGDEYLMPMEDGKKLPQILDEIKSNYEANSEYLVNIGYVGAIGVNWRTYGTSGHKIACEGLCIENYKYRAEDEHFQNVHIKSIVNPRVVTEMYNPHFVYLKEGYRCISEKGSNIQGPYFYDSICCKLRINHYISKSEQELREKIKRGWPDRDIDMDIEKEIYEMSVNCSKVFDYSMEKYVEEVKKRVNL